MKRKGEIVKPPQEAYLERLLPPREPVLREMEEKAKRENIPISDPEVGRILSILARATGARHILEVGAAIGYGTLCLARGFLERAGVADRVELIEGTALEVLPRLEGPPLDLVYIDAVKTEYRRYLDLLLPKVRVGGLLVCDNLLWGGLVADPPDDEPEDDETRALRAFNGYLMMHPQLQSVVLPVGDGLGLATKTKPLIVEMGGPF